MQQHLRRNTPIKALLGVLLLIGFGLACRLTSPTPASWVGTPTEQARLATNAVVLMTQEVLQTEAWVFTPTEPSLGEQPTPTISPTIPEDGPWLVYPAPDGGGIHAFDVDAKTILEISLPEPVFTTDLLRGLSPDGKTLVIRAGSPLNIDELALYQINLPATEVKMISPLLSISVQRKIVNEVGTRALETLEAVTREDGLAWSFNGRFLAFNAALDNESSDLYVLDTLNDRIERINGLYTQNASPFWSRDSQWLISQELEYYGQERGWRSENISGLRVPGYDDQNTLYLPVPDSQNEVFVGWTTVDSFVAYSQTSQGHKMLRQVNLESLKTTIIFEGFFEQAAIDPLTGTLAFSLSDSQGASSGMVGGVYLIRPESNVYSLQRSGDWERLFWDVSGRLTAFGSQGVFMISAADEQFFLPGEGDVLLSPSGNWMLGWGDGEGSTAGLRLYQPLSDHVLQTITQAPVKTVIWEQNSKAFFMQSEGVLYHLAFPGLNLNEIEAGFSDEEPLELIWLE